MPPECSLADEELRTLVYYGERERHQASAVVELSAGMRERTYMETRPGDLQLDSLRLPAGPRGAEQRPRAHHRALPGGRMPVGLATAAP